MVAQKAVHAYAATASSNPTPSSSASRFPAFKLSPRSCDSTSRKRAPRCPCSGLMAAVNHPVSASATSSASAVPATSTCDGNSPLTLIHT
eukprot:3542239-Rhodomonas_salina.4